MATLQTFSEPRPARRARSPLRRRQWRSAQPVPPSSGASVLAVFKISRHTRSQPKQRQTSSYVPTQKSRIVFGSPTAECPSFVGQTRVLRARMNPQGGRGWYTSGHKKIQTLAAKRTQSMQHRQFIPSAFRIPRSPTEVCGELVTPVSGEASHLQRRSTLPWKHLRRGEAT